MSKLQNRNTYIIGIIYCWFGALEVGSLIYVAFGVYTSDKPTYSDNLFLLEIVAIAIIGGIGIVALLFQTPYLINDSRFD